jgi:hypothetical protein
MAGNADAQPEADLIIVSNALSAEPAGSAPGELNSLADVAFGSRPSLKRTRLC